MLPTTRSTAAAMIQTGLQCCRHAVLHVSQRAPHATSRSGASKRMPPSGMCVAGSVNRFHVAEGLTDIQKQELAWSSFALLKNVNCCSVLVLRDGNCLLARGALSADAVSATPGGPAALAALGSLLSLQMASSGEASAVLAGRQQQLYAPDRRAMGVAGLENLGCVPAGANALLAVNLPGSVPGCLLVLSDRARGLGDKDRAWVTAMAAKLGAALG